MKEELVQTAKDKKSDQWGDRAVLGGKTTVFLTPSTDAFHELEHFLQETPEQPHPNTPSLLSAWGLVQTHDPLGIYLQWKCTTEVPGPKFCCFTQSAWRCKFGCSQ